AARRRLVRRIDKGQRCISLCAGRRHARHSAPRLRAVRTARVRRARSAAPGRIAAVVVHLPERCAPDRKRRNTFNGPTRFWRIYRELAAAKRQPNKAQGKWRSDAALGTRRKNEPLKP